MDKFSVLLLLIVLMQFRICSFAELGLRNTYQPLSGITAVHRVDYKYEEDLITDFIRRCPLEPTLTYFDMSGLGEPIRLMLSLTRGKFKDVRVNKDQWQKLKPSLKWQFLPMLEIDGKVLFQSMAIYRFLAREAGLTGSNPKDALLCDMTADHLNDMRAKVARVYYGPNSEERTEKLKDVAANTIPTYLERFQEQLDENGGYLVEGRLTWADVIFLAFSGYVSHMLDQDILEKFPDLKKHQERLKELPRIKEWMDSRPPEPADFRVNFF